MTPSKEFSVGMASDAMGSRTAQIGALPPASDLQTSHNWSASDTNPAAGASAPTDPRFFGTNNFAGHLVSCARCHDPHGTAVAYSTTLFGQAPVITPANPQLLKLGPNTVDAMCVACHTTWNITPADAYLTHPMQSNYPGFQAANTAKYKPFAANGQMTLDPSGNITCTTCHGTHFTDSDASTVDGMGQPLNTGDGRMLKGNGRLTGDASSVCQSCHIYKSHGAGQVGCIDCHSGHSYNNGSPNYFVLRSDVPLASYPANPPTNPGTNLVFNSPTYPWKSSGNGYCEGCHTLSDNHQGLNGAQQGTACVGCHNHADTNAAFTAGNCTTCHGYPPSQAPGAAAGYTGNEATSPHAIHAESTNYDFSCATCHTGNSHNTGTFQDVGFSDIASLNPGASYVTGTTGCQAVYCHGNGTPRGGAYKAANKVWAGGINGINDCFSCHGNSVATMAAGDKANSLSHAKHLAKGYSCSLCHNSTAASATVLAVGADKVGGTHVNGVKEVDFDTASGLTRLNAVNGSYNAVNGTCASIYCHSAGPNATSGATPDWDLAASGACGTCHDVSGQTLPDAHNTHVFATDGPQLACTICHTNNGTGADHVNGFINTVASMQTAVCNVCHGVDGAEVAPSWTVAGSDDCVTCHTGSALSTIGTLAPAQNNALTKGHNLPTGNYAVSGYAAANLVCENCHDKNATHLTGSGNKRLKPAFSCDTCHGTSGTASVKNINTHESKNCLVCHDPHGTANIYMVRTASADYNNSGGAANVSLLRRTGLNSFDEADSNNKDDLCATCHTAANQTVQHNNKENIGTHISGSKQGTDCMTCHKPHTDAVNAFGVGSGTSCDGCHGFPPTSAVHVQHNITTADHSDAADRTDCAACHTGANLYTYAGTGDQPGLNHGNAAGRLTILGTAVGYNSTNKTCATACHTSTVGNGGTWTSGATLACDACHYYSATPTSAGNTTAGAKALTGNHGKHFDAGKTCADCHTVPANLTHISVAATGTDLAKIQGKATATMDEADILGGLGSDPDPGNATCNNAACHNPSATTYSATWTLSTSSCDLCHSSTDPATSNHTAHLNTAATFGVTIACTDCHVNNGVNMKHLNGTKDMAGKVLTFVSPNCTNDCHQNGRNGVAAVTATWGMVPQANCTICHIQQPTTGSHTKHIAASATCADCHDNTVDNTTAAVQHLDLNIDAFDATPADLGYPADKALNTAFTTCNAAVCHSDGRGALVTTPVWGVVSACNECHAAAPVTGSHSAHLAATGVVCADCHTGTTQGTTAGAGHRDTNIDTAVALGYPQNKAIASAFVSCATASCHDNGLGVAVASPVWGTAINNCSECHLTQPGTGSHTAHLASGSLCADCHNGAVQGTTASTQHGDNNVDVYKTVAGDLGYPQNVAKGSGTWTTCNAASCHNNGQSGNNADLGLVGASLVTTPQWGTTATCSECHVAVPTSAKHDEHLGSYGATCGDCHDGAIQNSNGGSGHLNGLINVRTQLAYTAAGTPGNGWGTCTNPAGLAGACHGTAEARNWDGGAGGCTACHGQSGTTGEPLIATDMISTLPLGQHNTHVNTKGYSCNTCHNGHGMPTIDNKVTIAFTGAMTTGGTYNPPATWTAGKWLYNQTSTNARQDCSNLYCHSSAQANGGVNAPTYATPDWGNTASGACGTCHLNTTIATGSHSVHLADSANCNNCHSGNTHVNQLIEVTSVTYTSAGAPRNGYGTCSTASCHDNGTGALVTTPTWGATAACTECHAAVPATNSHPIHLALTGVNCGTCHQGAVQGSNAGVAHRNNLIDTVAALGYTDTTKGAPYGTCATASCHTDGLGNTVASPVWGVDVTDCSTCHAKAPATGSHSAHFADGAVCNRCHAGAIEGVSIPATNHMKGTVNVDGTPLNTYANNPAAIGSGSWTTCSTADCHTTGQAVAAYAVTPAWGVNAPNCSQCHAASPTSGSHTKHISINNDCVTCHTGAIKDISYASAAHRDNNIDVAVGGYTANKALGSAKQSCAAISCHSDGLTGTSGTSPVWGVVTPNCTACHAAAPATGSHTVHLADGATCANCHKDAVQSTTAPSVIHTDGDVDVFNLVAGDLGYPANRPIGSGSWTTCNAASCHDDGRGVLVTTPNWGTASTCNECHLSTPTTGSHSKHLALSGVNCGTCHTGAVLNSNGGTGHRDNNVDTVPGLGYPQNKTKGTAFASCATASCHNNGLGVTVASPVWGGTTTCNSCHATAPATGSHAVHLSNGSTCGSCHSNAVQGTTAPNVPAGIHANNNVEVFDVTSADLGYPATAALGAGSWTTCNAASCHDNGTGTLVTTPVWGTASACNECHAAAPNTGAHTKHLTSAILPQITCATCHVGTTQGTTAGAGHRDGNIDVSGGFGYPLNKTKGSAYSTCNTSYCHGNAMPKGTTSGTTNAPNWNASSTGCTFCHAMAPLGIAAHAGKTATDCITCHDNTNAAGTGFVNKNLHIDGILQGGGDSCSDCHSNVGYGLSGAHKAHNFVAFNGLLSNNDYGKVAAGWYATSYVNDTVLTDAVLDGGIRRLSLGCGYCHPATVAGHMTKQVSLSTADAGAAGTLKARNGAGAAYNLGVCSQVYCHGDGAGTFKNSPSWATGTLTGNCNDCHGNSPTTNAHSVHTVGIHYTDLYDSDRTGLMQAAAATNAAHGNIATSTTITCVICHGDTVTLKQNDKNDVCTTCHSGATTKGNLGIATTSVTHVNGLKDVKFNMTGFKTTAQLRDDITSVAELNTSWTRTNGYKQAAGTSHDAAKTLAPTFTTGTCSAVACHNGINASWTDPVASNCQKCHTALPQ